MEDYLLCLHYETGETKIFDVKPYLSGSWFGELKDRSYFRTVQMLPDGAGIEWSNGQDIAPHELYELSVTQ
jgi:hypothetical protein